MTTEVVTVGPSTPFKEIVARLAAHRISGVPGVDADRRVLGVVSEADLLLEQEHPDPKTDTPLSWTRHRRRERENAAVAGRLMTAPAATVPETTTLTEAARRMHTTRINRCSIPSRLTLLTSSGRGLEGSRSQVQRSPRRQGAQDRVTRKPLPGWPCPLPICWRRW
jgi:hypothetical protein